MSIQQELIQFLNQQGIQSVGFAHLEQDDIPVSYTHLDVYKRQVLVTGCPFRLVIFAEISTTACVCSVIKFAKRKAVSLCSVLKAILLDENCFANNKMP